MNKIETDAAAAAADADAAAAAAYDEELAQMRRRYGDMETDLERRINELEAKLTTCQEREREAVHLIKLMVRHDYLDHINGYGTNEHRNAAVREIRRLQEEVLGRGDK